MSHESGKAQSYWQCIHHLGTEAGHLDNWLQGRTYQEPTRTCHQRISPPCLGSSQWWDNLLLHHDNSDHQDSALVDPWDMLE